MMASHAPHVDQSCLARMNILNLSKRELVRLTQDWEGTANIAGRAPESVEQNEIEMEE